MSYIQDAIMECNDLTASEAKQKEIAKKKSSLKRRDKHDEDLKKLKESKALQEKRNLENKAKNESYRRRKLKEGYVLDFFNSKGINTDDPEVRSYADGVETLLSNAPANYTITKWWKDTEKNYPEDIKWLLGESYRDSQHQPQTASAKKPKYWDTRFKDKVIDAYKSGKLTLQNISEWETEYNDGVVPHPSLGTREILQYYLSTLDESYHKRRNLKKSLNESKYQVGQHVTYDTNPRGVTPKEKSGVIVKVSRGIATHGYSDSGYIYKIQDDNGNINTVDEFAISSLDESYKRRRSKKRVNESYHKERKLKESLDEVWILIPSENRYDDDLDIMKFAKKYGAYDTKEECYDAIDRLAPDRWDAFIPMCIHS